MSSIGSRPLPSTGRSLGAGTQVVKMSRATTMAHRISESYTQLASSFTRCSDGPSAPGPDLPLDRNAHVLSTGVMGIAGREMYVMGIAVRCAHVHGRDVPLETVSRLHSALGRYRCPTGESVGKWLSFLSWTTAWWRRAEGGRRRTRRSLEQRVVRVSETDDGGSYPRKHRTDHRRAQRTVAPFLLQRVSASRVARPEPSVAAF